MFPNLFTSSTRPSRNHSPVLSVQSGRFDVRSKRLGLWLALGLTGWVLSADEPAALFLSRATAPRDLELETLPDGSVPRSQLFRASEGPPARIPTLGAPDARFPIVEVKLNGKPLLAVVDTGAATSVVTLPAAVRLGLVPFGNPAVNLRATGFGGDTRLVLAFAKSLAIGDLPLSNVLVAGPAFSSPELPFPRMEERQVEMLLGFDVLEAFHWVEFNQPEGFLVFSPLPEMKETGGGGVHLPIRRREGHGPQVTAKIHREFQVTLDTGGYFGLRLPPSIARDNQVHAPLMLQPVGRRSVSGDSATLRAGRHTLRLGGMTLQNLPVEINHGNEAEAEKIGALLGNPVLSRVRWILDFSRDRVVFFP